MALYKMIRAVWDRLQFRAQAMGQNIYDESLGRIQKISFDHEKIEARLGEIESEWDIERSLVTRLAAAGLAGALLGLSVNRKWWILPTLASGFLLQQSLTGESLPWTLLRNAGFRRREEIEKERVALKALRGDFTYKHSAFSPSNAFYAAVR